ncbi:hypothetical protein [Spirosoma telluris]
MAQFEKPTIYQIETLKRVRQESELFFFTRLTRPDGSFKASKITNELYRALWMYRIGLLPIWSYNGENKVENVFYFPEKSPLDWNWLVEQFFVFYEILDKAPGYNFINQLMGGDFLIRLLSERFSVTCQIVAYKKLPTSEDIIQHVFADIELYIRALGRKLIAISWALWERPPYDVNLQRAKTLTSFYKSKKVKVTHYGLPIDSFDYGISKDDYLSILSGEIEVGEAVISYLTEAVAEEKMLPRDTLLESAKSTVSKEVTQASLALFYYYCHEKKCLPPFVAGKMEKSYKEATDFYGLSWKPFQQFYNRFCKSRNDRLSIENRQALKNAIQLLNDYPEALELAKDELSIAETRNPLT